MTLLRGDENILDTLRIAFLMERGMQAFYLTAAGKVAHESSSKTFATLGAVEEKHMLKIFDLFTGLTDERGVTFEEFKSRMESDVMEGGVPLLDGLAKASELDFDNAKEVYEFAREREKDSYEFYRGLSAKTTDANAGIILDNLAESEAEHIELIEKEIARLATYLYR